MRFGIDRLLAEPELRAQLKGRRVALLGHPASVTEDLTHSMDALMACPDIRLTAAFGPQHGARPAGHPQAGHPYPRPLSPTAANRLRRRSQARHPPEPPRVLGGTETHRG